MVLGVIFIWKRWPGIFPSSPTAPPGKGAENGVTEIKMAILIVLNDKRSERYPARVALYRWVFRFDELTQEKGTNPYLSESPPQNYAKVDHTDLQF